MRKRRQRVSRNLDAEENAVKTQIWIAVLVYVLVAIVRKRLVIEASPYETLQVRSVTLFEQVPILQLFGDVAPQENQMQFLTR